jgi:two-component system phosphate regulon sensor histidine kinase PhoR
MRTPLTVIYGYLEAMEESSSVKLQVWNRAVVQMRKQTERLKRIVDDLLLLSRIDSGHSVEKFEQVAVAGLLETIIEQAHELGGDANHHILASIDKDLTLLGHEGELYSLFSNLVFNAVRYTPARGEIEVTWQNSKDGPCFAVTDTGLGIAEAHIPRLTERFYRVDIGRSREVGGTGLGLAIAKHVIKRHQAIFTIKSQLGSGSKFSCVFPAKRAVMNLS